MTVEEYRANFQLIIQAARLVHMVDIPQLLNDIERADSIGAMLDPTLYCDKHGAMMEDKEVLEAALPLWRMAKKLLEGALAANAAAAEKEKADATRQRQ